MAAIELNGLTKRFGAVTAVDDLTLELGTGTVTGLLGPNGAGKTTTLRMLLGLVAPSAGTATFDGRRYVDLDEPARHVGAVLEASSFHPGRRAVDHLRILASAAGLPAQRVDEALAQVAMTEHAHRRVGGFSLGMRQRLGLAGALLGEPSVLVLDEPANGLDPEGVHWLRRLPAQPGRRRTHRRRVQSPARRGRPDRRPRRDPRQGPTDHQRPAGRAHRPVRARPSSFAPPTPTASGRS